MITLHQQVAQSVFAPPERGFLPVAGGNDSAVARREFHKSARRRYGTVLYPPPAPGGPSTNKPALDGQVRGSVRRPGFTWITGRRPILTPQIDVFLTDSPQGLRDTCRPALRCQTCETTQVGSLCELRHSIRVRPRASASRGSDRRRPAEARDGEGTESSRESEKLLDWLGRSPSRPATNELQHRTRSSRKRRESEATVAPADRRNRVAGNPDPVGAAIRCRSWVGHDPDGESTTPILVDPPSGRRRHVWSYRTATKSGYSSGRQRFRSPGTDPEGARLPRFVIKAVDTTGRGPSLSGSSSSSPGGQRHLTNPLPSALRRRPQSTDGQRRDRRRGVSTKAGKYKYTCSTPRRLPVDLASSESRSLREFCDQLRGWDR